MRPNPRSPCARPPATLSATTASRTCRATRWRRAVGRGHVSLLTKLDTWQCKPFRGVGHPLMYAPTQCRRTRSTTSPRPAAASRATTSSSSTSSTTSATPPRTPAPSRCSARATPASCAGSSTTRSATTRSPGCDARALIARGRLRAQASRAAGRRGAGAGASRRTGG
jgi:hypothetical protein